MMGTTVRTREGVHRIMVEKRTRKEKALEALSSGARMEPCLWCGEMIHPKTYFFPYCGRPCKDQGEESTTVGPGKFSVNDLKELGRLQAREMEMEAKRAEMADDVLHCHVCLTHPRRRQAVNWNHCPGCGFKLFDIMVFERPPSLEDLAVYAPEIH